MLSSLSSFLPLRLHGNNSKDLPRAMVNPDDEQSDDEEPPAITFQPENKPGKPKDRDGKGPTETFVFVRPPPSKSNHPLNLQVQLVPPNSRPPTGVTDCTPSTPISATSSVFSTSDGTSLRRTASNRSNRSNRSQTSASTFNNSSTTSFASIASTTASSATRRAIIPLYNLQAHNVMTNVIVDAGTDAKIAKFQKRGIELIDFAFLEPVEVWGEKEGSEAEKRMRRESMRLSVDEVEIVVSENISAPGSVRGGAVRSKKSSGSFLPTGAGTGSGTATGLSAASSAISLNSQPTFSSAHGGSQGEHPSQQDNRHLRPSQSRSSVRSDTKSPVLSSPTLSDQSSAPTPTQKKNIFGKLFNKKSSGVPSTPSSNSSMTPTGTTHSKQTEFLPSFSSFSVLHSPKASQRPEEQDESLLQTPTAEPKEKHGHGRNLSLTGITAPIKSTLKNNRNRFSGLVNGMSNTNALGALGIRDEGAALARSSAERRRDDSPNPSVTKSARSRLSWVGGSTTTHSTDSLSAENGPTMTAPTPTQLQTYALTISPSNVEGTPTTRQAPQQQLQLRPPVLGCQPSFVSAAGSVPLTHLAPTASPLVSAMSPRISSERDAESFLQGQRAQMYVWLVRKWLKKRVSTILGAEATAAAMVGGLFGKRKEVSTAGGEDISGPPPLPYGGVEVRFEWKRAKGKEAKRGRRSRSRMASGVSSIMGAGAESDGEVEPSARLKLEQKRKNRMSTGSYSTTVSEENGFGLHSSPGSKQMKRDEDDGEESDPEDSETPWVCTLKFRRSAAAVVNGSAAASANGGRISPVPPTPILFPSGVPVESQVLRIKVGTLSPTPHHPKVVAMLKVPFPLPDIEVERMEVIKRGVRLRSATEGDASAAAERDPYAGLVLTAEEIKDVVCSTGLWLVVREGFGGVGKVTRKGDGWRIRG